MFLRISDRYIMKSFIYSFFICFTALVSLFVVFDTFDKLPNLVSAWRKTATPVLRLVLMILKMNATRMPLVFYELAPVLTLAAAMFTVVALRRANELTPLLASGVSMYRILWPIFLMAILLGALQVVDKEILIPRYADELHDWDRMREDTAYRERRLATLVDGYSNVIFAGRYVIADRVQLSANLTRYYRDMRVSRPMVMLNAATASWHDSPPGWLYRDGTRIRLDRVGNVLSQSRFGPAGLFVPCVPDGPVPPEFDLVTDATPIKIETEEVDIFYRPSLYLLQYIHDHGMRADIAFDLNKRMAVPLTNIILLLIGLPFVLKRQIKSPFLGVAVAVAIAGAYFATGLICENFAVENRFFTPLTGAWAPIIIFGPIGVLIFDTVES